MAPLTSPVFFFLPRSLLEKLLLGTGRGEIEEDDLPFSSSLMAKHFPSDLVTISVRFQFWHEDTMPILKSIQLCFNAQKRVLLLLPSHYPALSSIFSTYVQCFLKKSNPL